MWGHDAVCAYQYCYVGSQCCVCLPVFVAGCATSPAPPYLLDDTPPLEIHRFASLQEGREEGRKEGREGGRKGKRRKGGKEGGKEGGRELVISKYLLF